VLPTEGLVDNVLPDSENTTISILGSPRLRANFTDYIVTLHNGRKNSGFAGEEGVQSFIYVVDGKLNATAGDEKFEFTQGGYLYCPPGVKMKFENAQYEDTKVYLY